MTERVARLDAELRAAEDPAAASHEPLHESRELYRNLFAMEQDAILLVDVETGQFVDANAAAVKLYGYSREGLLRMRPADLSAEPDKTRAAIDRGERKIAERRHRKKDGTVFPVEITGTYFEDGQGRRLHAAAIRDISDRKRVDQALQESEAKYRLLHESMRDAFASTSMDGRILEFNTTYQSMLGYTAEELRSKTYVELTPVRWHDFEARIIREQVLSRGYSDVYEKEYRRKDGTVFPVELRTSLTRGADGEPSAMWAIVRDITNRKRAEEALRESEKKFRSLYDAMREGVALHEVVYDAAGQAVDYVMLAVNPAFEAITGLKAAQVQGRKASGVYGTGTPPYLDVYARVAESGQSELFESAFEPMGRFFRISVFSPAKGQFATVFEDITEHLRLEAQFQQAQKMESVGRLAGGVAHDFNNLLTGIMGNAELCREALGTGNPLRVYLDEITGEAQRSAAITRQLLAFARRQTIAPVALDLNDAVSGMLKLLRRLLGEDIELVWIPGGWVSPIKMDPSQLDQILANLIVNARDAIGGVGKLTIETRNVTLDQAYCEEHAGCEPGSYVMLSVSDTGCGMDRETLEHIFEPFFTTKGVGEGTGLGLATVYGIVKQNEGFVYAESEPAKGATFRIYLPRCAVLSPDGAAGVSLEACPGGTETILVVEDERAIRVTTEALLETLGYTVRTAESPKEALRLAAEHTDRIDLLITDVVMPGMSGRDVASRLVEQHQETKCLYMSGYTADIVVNRGVLDEGIEFLAKPFTRHDLARKVREVLDKK